MNKDLFEAYDHFKKVYPRYSALFDYYDGNQPLRYTTERLREAFDQRDVKFRQNWCAVVVNSVLDRLELFGWSAGDERVSAMLADAWTRTGLALESNEVHETALITGESYLIGWKEDGGEPEFYYNDPRRCWVCYDEDRPKVKRYAAKWYDSPAGARMVLYYPDRIEYYSAEKTFKEIGIDNGGANAFRLEGEAVNPYGIIPVFHFRNGLRRMKSELQNVTELQDAINKLLCDMMVTAEFSAFPARYVISNADIAELRNSPNQIWDLPAGMDGGQSTQVGTLAAADLANYSDQIDRLASSIAIITSTPKHYFSSTSDALSGEALITMEAPLVKKVQNRRELFGDTWSEVGAFACLLEGVTIDKVDIVPQWGKAESEQPLTETEIIRNYIGAGLPKKTALRLSGYTAAEIALIEEEAAEEKAASASLGSLLLENARAEDSRSDEG